MKGSFESRLERLEKALGGEETPVLRVGLVDFVNVPPEPIAGWRSYDGFDCPRAPFESEEHLAERAKAEARLTVRPSDSGVIVLCSYCRDEV
jgi:hypothetical protein